MSQKTADSVKFEVTVGFHADEIRRAKRINEQHLWARAVDFFGHEDVSHTGYRHDPTDPDGLRTYAIFYDDTPYEGGDA